MADACVPAPPEKAAPSVAELSDDEIFAQIVAGKLKEHALEATLGDCARATRLRRRWLEKEVGTMPEGLPHEGFDYESVLGACAEMVVGYVPLPVGVAGPLKINGKAYQVPMATVEGCLIASARRGMKAITTSGGAQAAVLKQGMTRAPVIFFPSAMRAAALKSWIEEPENFATMKGWFESTSRFAKLKSCAVTVAGLHAYPRFVCFTGDAMGMNMVSKGVNNVLEQLEMHAGFDDMRVLGLSGNVCCDKKPAAINWVEGRGCSVVVEATITGKVVRETLKTTVEAMLELNSAKNLVGSAMAGAVGGFNAHAANIVAAVFIATGQDAAQVVESANCITLLAAANGGEDLHISCTMPSVEVGTVGGGTILKPQRACLELLGVAGAAKDEPGAHARALATVVAGAVLAGELSLLAALSAGHLMKAHMALNRKPAAAPAPAPAVNVE